MDAPLLEGDETQKPPVATGRSAEGSEAAAERAKAAAAKRQARVNLEGSDWLLTTLLITLDAVLVQLYQVEETKRATFVTWFVDYDCGEGWQCAVYNILFILGVAVANCALLMPVLNVNVRIPTRRNWRFWVVVAWFGLVLCDVLTVWQLIDSIRKCADGDDDDVSSWTAHFWLIAMALLLALALNIRFVYLYGWCSYLRLDGDRTLRTTPGLTPVYYVESKRRQRHLMEQQNLHYRSRVLEDFGRGPPLKRFNTGKFLDSVSHGFQNFVGKRVRMVKMPAMLIRSVTSDADSVDSSAHVSRLLDSSWLTNCKGYLYKRIRQAHQEVAEVENVFEYSSWIKSAVIFSIIMLFYSCILAMQTFFDLASSWTSMKDLAVLFQEQLVATEESINELAAALSYVEQTAFPSPEQQAQINQTVQVVEMELYQLEATMAQLTDSGSSAYDLAALMVNGAMFFSTQLVHIANFDSNSVVEFFYYMDSLIPILQYTCLFGYPIGVCIGLYSLYHVLVQHKRMSLALEEALSKRTAVLINKQELSEEDAEHTLLGIDKKYEIAGSVYFFGILMSTAVVQMQVFALAITIFLAICADFKNFDLLLNLGGYIVFVYVAVMVTNLSLTHVIGDRLLTREGFQIQHPWLFFIYLFTFSMVHAVLGFLYAVWRGVLLLVTTFWVLNRLDVSLFVAGQQLDNGHYSFMSMLLLTRVIRLTNIAQGYVQRPGHQGLSDSDVSGELPPGLGIERDDSLQLEEPSSTGPSRQASLPVSYEPPAQDVTAAGRRTQLSGPTDVTTGSGTQATGPTDVTAGSETQATGPTDVTAGSETQATGPTDVTAGSETQATGPTDEPVPKVETDAG